MPPDAAPTSPSDTATSVFIAGGGPVGLSMAVLLDRFGIDYVLAERNPTTTHHPKARGCNARTMELFRQWGIERDVRFRGLPDGVDPVIVVESLAGPEFGRVRAEPHDTRATPATTCHVTQDVVEEVLLAAVRTNAHGRLLFSTEVVAHHDLAGGVEVTTASADGETTEWTCEYFVAADGAGSRTRTALEIEMLGPETLAVWANDFWRADIGDHIRGRETVSFIVVPPDPRAPSSMLFTSDRKERYLTWTQLGEGEDDADVADWTKERVIDAIHQQVGASDFEVEMLGQAIWRMSSQVAARFREGRVFLVGDAAHRFPPTGGLGMNTGIQDAHNLAWKLAFVLRGHAGPDLLDTYEPERRPIAQSNADWSVGNAGRLNELIAGVRSRDNDRIAFWLKDMEHHVHQTGRALGFTYDEGALIPDGTVARPLDSRTYRPSDRPGGRFPHLWLDLSRQHSTLDWFDRDLTLVTGPQGDAWTPGAAELASRWALPLAVRTLACPPRDSGIEIGPRGAALVRPDGHVAWRAPWLPEEAAPVLGDAIARVLDR